MANHTQRGSIVVDAFQWPGGTGAAAIAAIASLPVWAKQLALHTPGDGALHVPLGARGTARANATDWVVQLTPGYIEVMTAAAFTILYA